MTNFRAAYAAAFHAWHVGANVIITGFIRHSRGCFYFKGKEMIEYVNRDFSRLHGVTPEQDPAAI